MTPSRRDAFQITRISGKRHPKNKNGHKGLQDTLCPETSTEETIKGKYMEISNPGIPRHGYRNSKVTEGQGLTKKLSKIRIPVHHVPQKEVQRRNPAYVQSKEFEPIPVNTKISPHKPLSNPSTPKEKRFHDENRYLAGLFSYPSKPRTPPISVPFISWNSLRNDLLAIRVSKCPINICKSYKLDATPAETERHSNPCIPRRFSHISRGPDYSRRSSSHRAF